MRVRNGSRLQQKLTKTKWRVDNAANAHYDMECQREAETRIKAGLTEAMRARARGDAEGYARAMAVVERTRTLDKKRRAGFVVDVDSALPASVHEPRDKRAADARAERDLIRRVQSEKKQKAGDASCGGSRVSSVRSVRGAGKGSNS